MKTLQEIFDEAVTGLLKQGKRSWSTEEGNCAYRGDDGCKCAVGFLIDDQAYNPELEGCGVRDTLVVAALEASGLEANGGNLELLSMLQGAHDDVEVESWKDTFTDIAVRYHLTMPEVEVTHESVEG